MLIALILASGKGTRLRPLSTDEIPKQYLKVITGKTLIEDTIDRVKNIIPYDNIFVVTNEKQKSLALNTFTYLKKENIIFEPEMKETLATITHGISYIKKLRKDNFTFLILPSDHFISPTAQFEQSIVKGLDLLKNNDNFLLYGLRPTFPSPEFGYIKTKLIDNLEYVDTFVEKPSINVAEQIYQQNNYYWNNFIMLLKDHLLLESIEKILPEQYLLIDKYIKGDIDTNEFFSKTVVQNFSKAILEKQESMLLVPVSYTWYDIGGFEQLFAVLKLLNKENEISKIKNLIKEKTT